VRPHLTLHLGSSLGPLFTVILNTARQPPPPALVSRSAAATVKPAVPFPDSSWYRFRSLSLVRQLVGFTHEPRGTSVTAADRLVKSADGE
jgi:hypothetical protein